MDDHAGRVPAALCISTQVVNVSASADTGNSVDTRPWAATQCSLIGAAVILTSGSLGDVFGRKRVSQLGLLSVVTEGDAHLRAEFVAVAGPEHG